MMRQPVDEGCERWAGSTNGWRIGRGRWDWRRKSGAGRRPALAAVWRTSKSWPTAAKWMRCRFDWTAVTAWRPSWPGSTRWPAAKRRRSDGQPCWRSCQSDRPAGRRHQVLDGRTSVFAHGRKIRARPEPRPPHSTHRHRSARAIQQVRLHYSHCYCYCCYYYCSLDCHRPPAIGVLAPNRGAAVVARPSDGVAVKRNGRPRGRPPDSRSGRNSRDPIPWIVGSNFDRAPPLLDRQRPGATARSADSSGWPFSMPDQHLGRHRSPCPAGRWLPVRPHCFCLARSSSSSWANLWMGCGRTRTHTHTHTRTHTHTHGRALPIHRVLHRRRQTPPAWLSRPEKTRRLNVTADRQTVFACLVQPPPPPAPLTTFGRPADPLTLSFSLTRSLWRVSVVVAVPVTVRPRHSKNGRSNTRPPGQQPLRIYLLFWIFLLLLLLPLRLLLFPSPSYSSSFALYLFDI